MKGSWAPREQLWTLAAMAVGAVALAALLWPPLKGLSSLQLPPPPRLEKVLERGTLRVATVNSPVTYYNIQDREQGFEFDLAREFASFIGVDLEIVTVPHFSDLFEHLASGTVDLAAANITVTPDRHKQIRFGPEYDQVTQEVVYRAGSSRPRDPADLVGRNIVVVAGSSYVETLVALREQYPNLRWTEFDSGDIESIFAQIVDGEIDITVADSTALAIHQRFYPQLKKAFSLSDPEPIGWAFAPGNDQSLLSEARDFFQTISGNGLLDRIKDKYHAHLPGYNRVNTHYFLRHVQSRLPRLEHHFREAAQATGFDWKLLAAIAYQESHWDEAAVSPTGVRGIMMLTRATAGELGVKDRRDPEESIYAGARYLTRMKSRIPSRIAEPDRTWMALAAYNVGWGHLEDARVLTQRMGGDPDRWADVVRHLPLLANPEHYQQTRFGYARGREPVQYVRNIRSYYDILTWQVGRQNAVAVAP